MLSKASVFFTEFNLLSCEYVVSKKGCFLECLCYLFDDDQAFP